MKRILTLCTAGLAVFALCCSCRRSAYRELTGYAQGGTYRICYKSACSNAREQERECRILKDGIDSILCTVDTALSGYNPLSLVSRINRGEKISPDSTAQYALLAAMTAYADSICLATGGAVDCRAAALYDIWGFGFKSGALPDSSSIREAMEDKNGLNFNAIAQGYSADLVAGYMMGMGIRDMLVDIGGEFYCMGLNPKGRFWRIGIDSPIDGNNTPGACMAGTFSLPDGKGHGVVTSGNYRKFRIVDGRKQSHTIDPRSGYPVTHNLLSATITAPTSALADAIATYCMVIGAEEAARFIEGRNDLEACLISADSVWTSSGLSVNR